MCNPHKDKHIFFEEAEKIFSFFQKAILASKNLHEQYTGNSAINGEKKTTIKKRNKTMYIAQRKEMFPIARLAVISPDQFDD